MVLPYPLEFYHFPYLVLLDVLYDFASSVCRCCHPSPVASYLVLYVCRGFLTLYMWFAVWWVSALELCLFCPNPLIKVHTLHTLHVCCSWLVVIRKSEQSSEGVIWLSLSPCNVINPILFNSAQKHCKPNANGTAWPIPYHGSNIRH